MASDWRQARLGEADRALCAFAEKLTREPAAMRREDVRALARHGFDDDAVHDAVQVASMFAYFNRIADGLGVEHETFTREWERNPGTGAKETRQPTATPER